MDTIRITALRHSAFYTPLLMTMAGGFLKQEGLDYDYQPATDAASVPDSLRNGKFHLSQSAVAAGFADLEQGKTPDIFHFARINCRDGFFIASREPVQSFSWQHLIGKQVLVDHFFQPMAMLRYALHTHNIKLEQLDVIDAGNVTSIEKAFRSGSGDFVHMQGPAPQQLEHEGIAHVVASVGEVIGPVAFSSLCATHQWLQTEMASAFMHAYNNSLKYVASTEAAEIASQLQKAGFLTEINSEVLENTVAAYQKLGTWNTDPHIGRDEYETLLDVFMHSGIISKRHNYETLVVSPPA